MKQLTVKEPKVVTMDAKVIDELNDRWLVVENALKESVNRKADLKRIEDDLAFLINNGLSVLAKLWFISHMEKSITNFVRDFFNECKKVEDIKSKMDILFSKYERMITVCSWLDQRCTLKQEPMDEDTRLTEDQLISCLSLVDQCHKLMSSQSMIIVTPDFESLLHNFFQISFDAFNTLEKNEDFCDEYAQCPSCLEDIAEDETLCRCPSLVEDFKICMQRLLQMNLLSPLIQHFMESVCYKQIEKQISKACDRDFESRCISLTQRWLETTLTSWLQFFDIKSKDKLDNFREHLLAYLYDVMIDKRSTQLFDMIIEYPDSQYAIEDLKACVATNGGLSKIVENLKLSIRTRLLHQGVKTADIISIYVSTIKALRILDPTGFTLQSVCEPLSAYLKSRDSRDNTVRIIVSSLTDENNVELNVELGQVNQRVAAEGYASSDDEESDWEKWVPQARVSKVIKQSDIITLLVNIYGSKEVFVEEYASLLSQRLLSGTTDSTKELRYVELLKIRFGEMAMNNCDVMLNDVQYSRRLHTQIIVEKLAENFHLPLDVLIVSAQFWPELKEENFKLPEEVITEFDKFKKEYEILNGNRTVSLRPNLGWVELELTMDDGTTQSFKCTPSQASLINLFHEKDLWTMPDLCSSLECSRIIVKRLVSFWVSNGILRERKPGEWVVVGSPEDKQVAHPCGQEVDDDHDDEDEEDKLEDKGNAEMQARYQVYWGFVRGLLGNLGSAPLDRIHAMLGMFAKTCSQEFSLQDCKAFLDSKIAAQELIYQGGTYSLPK